MVTLPNLLLLLIHETSSTSGGITFFPYDWLYKLLTPHAYKESSIRHAISHLEMIGKVEKTERDGRIFVTAASKPQVLRAKPPRLAEWDGSWLEVIFDVPERKRLIRDQLRKRLTSLGFRQWQRSVWIKPGRTADYEGVIVDKDYSRDVKICLLEVSEIVGIDQEELAQDLWGLTELNKSYFSLAQRGGKIVDTLFNRTLNQRQRGSLVKEGQQVLVQIVNELENDPQLPESLLPKPWYWRELVETLDLVKKALVEL